MGTTQQINTLNLDNMPKLYAYEDYIASLLMFHGPYYLERSIKKKTSGIGDEFEWDIVTSQYQPNAEPVRRIVEIKSKGWGIDDIFKVSGWMTYMNHKHSLFIVQQTNAKNFGQLQQIAHGLDIELIDNPPTPDGKLDNTRILNTLGLTESSLDYSIPVSFRFSLHMERMMNDYLNKKRKEHGRYVCYDKIAECWSTLNNAPFFISDPNQRIKRIFDLYLEYKNLASRVDHELNGEGWLEPEQCKMLVDGHFIQLYYQTMEISPVHIAQYVELLIRVSILKACVDELLKPKETFSNPYERMLAQLGRMSIPSNIDTGLGIISQQPYFYLYPRFWQVFIYGFGGFILLDKEQQEKELLAKLSGIPVSEVDNAIGAFDMLFPNNRGWMRNYKGTNISMLNCMPPQIMGLGANMRRLLYRQGEDDKQATYDVLGSQLTGEYTKVNLEHWGGLAYKYLEKDDTLIKGVVNI